MVRSRARLTSAGSTAYNQETLVIPLSAKPNHAAVLMATTIPCKIHIPLRLPRPLNPNKTASKQNRAARQLRTCRWSRRPLNLSPFALAQISGGHATKSPLSELVARGSVQRRFLQRLRGSALALDYNHGVAETSPICECVPMTDVGHAIPAISACPVRPKSGHSANARVYEYTLRAHVAARVVSDAGTTPTIRTWQHPGGQPDGESCPSASSSEHDPNHHLTSSARRNFIVLLGGAAASIPASSSRAPNPLTCYLRMLFVQAARAVL